MSLWRCLAVLPVFASPLGAAACDNSQAIHEPDPSWARMIEQPRAEPYGTSDVFANHSAMRDPPAFTVPRGTQKDDNPPLTRARLELGRARFEVFCAVCHGYLGDGDTVVATKMELRRPPSLHEERLRALSDDQLLSVITQGYGLMSGYAVQLSSRERTAVVAYVRALQLSQHAPVGDLPKAMQQQLAREAP